MGVYLKDRNIETIKFGGIRDLLIVPFTSFTLSLRFPFKSDSRTRSVVPMDVEINLRNDLKLNESEAGKPIAIDWGDGSVEYIDSFDSSHIYKAIRTNEVVKEYNIKIYTNQTGIYLGADETNSNHNGYELEVSNISYTNYILDNNKEE